jgi:hypothetical protein
MISQNILIFSGEIKYFWQNTNFWKKTHFFVQKKLIFANFAALINFL